LWIVINAEKIKLTGKKAPDKFIITTTGFIVGLKQVLLENCRSNNPA